MNSSHLKYILASCVKQHRDQMTLLFGCLDSKREKLELFNNILKEKEIAEDGISYLFLSIFDTYATSGIAFIGIFVNMR